jgi:hypothetical protein
VPLAIDTVAGAAASGTTANAIVTFTPGAGDTFTVRNFSQPNSAQLDMLVGHVLQTNPIRLRSPMLHDNVQGLRFTAVAGDTSNLIAASAQQNLLSQDTLTAELVVATAPGASETETIAIGIYYNDLPGAVARLYSPGDITPNIKNLWSLPVSVTPSATAGVWGSAAINSVYDLFQANTDYAVLGYEVDTACTAIAIRGADTSNFRVGAPGIIDRYKTRQWFMDMTMWRGTPHIPVINSANKSATFVDVVTRLTSGAINVTLLLAELSQNLT